MRSYPLCENRKMYNRLCVRVRSTDPVLDWIVKSEANYICENHFQERRRILPDLRYFTKLYQADGFTFV